MNLRLSNCFCVVLLLTFLLSSCSNGHRYEQGRLSMEPDKADFGTIEPNDPIVFRDVSMTARNLGKQPLDIQSIELPEGFSYTILPGNVLNAGETASVKIMVDIRKLSGSVSQTAYVISNDPVQPRFPIELEAKLLGKHTSEKFEPGNEPDIEFDHKSVELGAIPRNEMVEHKFPFKNVGKKPLLIYSIETMCICISGRPSMSEVPPGGSAAIIARVEPYKYTGNAPWKALTVKTNDPDEPVINLTVAATIIEPVGLKPETVVLPNIRLGQEAHADVKLIQKAKQELIIEGIKSSSPSISVSTSPLEGGQKGYLLNITLAPDVPAGKFEEVITIFTNYTNAPPGAKSVKEHKDYSKLELPVKGTVTGAVSVTPDKINFGYGSPGKTMSRKLVVSSVTSSFDIQSLSISDPNFRASYTVLEPKKRYEITVEFFPGKVERQIEDKLVIKTTDAALEVPIYAAVKLNS